MWTIAFDFQDPDLDQASKDAAMTALAASVLGTADEDITGPAWSMGTYGPQREADMMRALAIRDAIMAYGDPFMITICGELE